MTFEYFFHFKIFLNICGIMAVIFAVRPWIMLPTLVLAVIFVLLRRFYMRLVIINDFLKAIHYICNTLQ